MGKRWLGLFVGLVLVGTVAGFLLGELFLGRGNGWYVAPLSAIVGLVVAWALWSTKGRGDSTVAVAQPVSAAGRATEPVPRPRSGSAQGAKSGRARARQAKQGRKQR